MVKPKVIITGGGTAGHTNPGIAVAEALVAGGLAAQDIHFVGGNRGNEAQLVPDAGFTISLLPGRGIQRKLTLENVGSVAALLVGLVKGFGVIVRQRPNVVLCLGGYAAFAASMAAVVLRVPLVISEQNARASAVNRLMSKWARSCALPFPDTDLPRGVLTGNPSRAAVIDSVRRSDRDAARTALGIPHDRVMIAVWAGSLGSTRINNAVRELAVRWSDRSDVAIHHVIGRRDWQEFRQLPEEVAHGALVYNTIEYEDRMPQVLVGADVAITRSGASTVAELSVAGLPSILVPLPGAPRDHQRANTAELVDGGGGVLVLDRDLTADRLESELTPLLDDRTRIAAMGEAAQSVARPDAAHRVAELLSSIGEFTLSTTTPMPGDSESGKAGL